MYLTDARIWCIILILYFVLRCAIKFNENRREQQEIEGSNENTAHIDNNSNNNNELAIGSDNDDNNNNNAEETRVNLINDRLVFRELSLSTESTQQEGKSNERDLEMTRTKETDVEDRDQDVLNTTTNDKNSNNTDVGDSVRSFFSSLGLFRQDGVIPKDVDCCSICLEEYKIGDTIARSNTGNNRDKTEEDNNNSNSCSHCFHKDCIVAWLQNHDECPLCRVDMITIPETRSISNGSS